MVGCGFAPLAAAEIVVIGSPAGIRTLHLRFGLFGRYVLLLAKATHPIFRSPRNENIHRAGMIPQDIVGTTAHENTRFPRGDVTDHIALYFEQRLAAQHIGHTPLFTCKRHAQITDQRGKEAPRLLLVGLLEKFRAEAALLGRQIDQLLVIDVHAQTTPQRLADGFAAAAELTAYIDNELILFHSATVFIHSLCDRFRLRLPKPRLSPQRPWP